MFLLSFYLVSFTTACDLNMFKSSNKKVRTTPTTTTLPNDNVVDDTTEDTSGETTGDDTTASNDYTDGFSSTEIVPTGTENTDLSGCITVTVKANTIDFGNNYYKFDNNKYYFNKENPTSFTPTTEITLDQLSSLTTLPSKQFLEITLNDTNTNCNNITVEGLNITKEDDVSFFDNVKRIPQHYNNPVSSLNNDNAINNNFFNPSTFEAYESNNFYYLEQNSSNSRTKIKCPSGVRKALESNVSRTYDGVCNVHHLNSIKIFVN
jgi:hypothetical protein